MQVGKWELYIEKKKKKRKKLAEKLDPPLAIQHPRTPKQQMNNFSKGTEGSCLCRWISKDILICLKMSESVVESSDYCFPSVFPSLSQIMPMAQICICLSGQTSCCQVLLFVFGFVFFTLFFCCLVVFFGRVREKGKEPFPALKT